MHRYVLLFCAAGFFIKYIIQECNVHQRKTREKNCRRVIFSKLDKKSSVFHINICTSRKYQRCPKKFCSILILLSVTHCPRSSDPFYIVSYYIKWVTLYTLI